MSHISDYEKHAREKVQRLIDNGFIFITRSRSIIDRADLGCPYTVETKPLKVDWVKEGF